jgi:hypothetical protein
MIKTCLWDMCTARHRFPKSSLLLVEAYDSLSRQRFLRFSFSKKVVRLLLRLVRSAQVLPGFVCDHEKSRSVLFATIEVGDLP